MKNLTPSRCSFGAKHPRQPLRLANPHLQMPPNHVDRLRIAEIRTLTEVLEVLAKLFDPIGV